ncbi:glycosyltransferase family 2 protein [Aliiroseovarius sp. PTFE2010]|uniref:glycosyltransferase family 2 protein n=1 Tax=Aliiroseovarius sp. PTFE2010 TaxID=3417190 RepID=UPI003CFAAE13
MLRLPYFLQHHRNLGVQHFLFVDNGSDDATTEFLAAQPDVSLWTTGASYRLSRFGMDWLTWLQVRYGDGHWCLTLDADELFIYPHHDTRSIRALAAQLDRIGARSFGTMMLDLYPKGRLDQQVYQPGDDPTDILEWFDSGNYIVQRQEPAGNLWIQGGPRARVFFADNPRRAPTLNKTPLVKWSRRYAYVSSTHSMLPPRLNRVYDTSGGERISGILLHTKFLHTAVARSREEKSRRQHFGNPADFDAYYDHVAAAPDLWTEHSSRLLGWRQLEAMGLMSRGGWV